MHMALGMGWSLGGVFWEACRLRDSPYKIHGVGRLV